MPLRIASVRLLSYKKAAVNASNWLQLKKSTKLSSVKPHRITQEPGRRIQSFQEMGVCFKYSYIQLHVDNCVDLQPLFAMNLIIACAHCCVNLVIMHACYTRSMLCVHTAATVSYEFN